MRKKKISDIIKTLNLENNMKKIKQKTLTNKRNEKQKNII